MTPTSKRKEKSEKHRESKEREREREREKKKFDIVHHENGRVLQKLQLNLTGCT